MSEKFSNGTINSKQTNKNKDVAGADQEMFKKGLWYYNTLHLISVPEAM